MVKRIADEAFFYFDEAEHWILQQLTSPLTIGQLMDRCRNNMRDQAPSPGALSEFVRMLAGNHLLLVGNERPIADDVASPSRRHDYSLHPLALRLPGIDASQFFDWAATCTRFIPRSLAFGIYLTLLAIAGGVAWTDFPALVTDIRGAAQRMPTQWVWFIMALALAKVCHEIAHASACHLAGGRCRNVGVMFLFGVPCLYCDVSDAWLMPQRWHRVLVSAAGMMAEWFIAAICVLIWWTSQPGILHDTASLLIMVCTASTLVFNGNPLMRYDGYFILSDLWGKPNLAQRSTTALREFAYHLFHGSRDASLACEHDDDDTSVALLVYGLASVLYRALVLSFISLVAMRWVSGTPWFWPVTLLIIATVVRVFFARIGKQDDADTAPNRSSHADPEQTRRPMMVGAAIVALSLVVLVVPLPRTLSVDGVVLPDKHQEIRLSGSGRIIDAVRPGIVLEQDQTILQADDWVNRWELLRCDAATDSIRNHINAIRLMRTQNPVLSQQLPALTEQLHASITQSQTLQSQLKLMHLRAEAGQMVFDTQKVMPSRDQKQRRWIGSPFASENRGCVVPAGQSLGLVGDANKRIVQLALPQEQLDLVRIGQHVRIPLSGRSDPAEGTIRSIAQMPSTGSGMSLRSAIDSFNVDLPAAQARAANSYQVNVELDASIFHRPLPVHLSVVGRIELPKAAIYQRVWRFLIENFSY
ncbi:HlyD family efflux transporter periplasmic adaptor subunit [Crateriforma conspicua]|uniref:HlyD family efflux transporter periplasmic adaptor subunit n=1 Tax=Crateriforma conspicua TaxID=2527996 RepID=UPI00118BEEA2|nr:HlyD family efflux transporter periplasmic adaptor subunit [Crateriforma conspicua]QDV65766.1 Peptidase family M50 [Crateriforma conspicua]